MKKLYIFLLLFAGVLSVKAQVSSYSFAATSGTYNTISGTTAASGTWDDINISAVPIGFNFVFNGTTYSTCTINTNGFISFGATAPSVSAPYTALNDEPGNTGVIAGWARDLQSQTTAPTGTIQYSSSGGVFTVQWSNTRRYNNTTNAERFNMQIKLYQSSNIIQVVYGSWSNAINSLVTDNGQVGLRGTTNADFNDLAVASGGSWAAPVTGTNNLETCFYGQTSTATKPVSGQTYTWFPSAPPNDNCINAITITPALACSPVPGTTTNATQQFPATACSGFTSSAANEVWYKFVANGTSRYVISVTGNGTLDLALGFYSAGCTAGNFISCIDAAGNGGTETITTAVLTAGTYYYRVYGYNGTSGTFNSCVTACGAYAGTIPVGATGTFVNLTEAITNLTVCGYTGNIVLELQSNYSSAAETFPIVFPAGLSSAAKTITVRPAIGVSPVISSSSGDKVINLDGANYVIFDGRPGGTVTPGTLSITSSATVAVFSTVNYLVLLTNNASYNQIKYCNINSTSALPFVQIISGNANIIDHNTFTADINATAYGIFANFNGNDEIISNNNFNNFLSPSVFTAAIYAGNNCSNWTITGNSVYCTSPVVTNGALKAFIDINAIGKPFTITNNYLGGTAPLAAGSPMSITTTGTTTLVRPVYLNNGLNSVQGNVIKNITLTAPATAIDFIGIDILSESSDVGTITPNIIGTTASPITITTTGTGATAYGIRVGTGADLCNIKNNLIQGFTIGSSAAGGTHNFSGIMNEAVYGSGNKAYFENNTISDITGTSGTGSPFIDGITMNGGGDSNLIYRNKIYNLSSASSGTTTLVSGIKISGGTSEHIVVNNIIGNLTASVANNTDAIRGINITSTAQPSYIDLFYNSIYLNATSTATNFGSSGLFHTNVGSFNTATILGRNNNIVNTSTPRGTGRTVAFRRSAAAGGVNNFGYASATNNNLYAGTPDGVHLLYFDNTTGYLTIAALAAMSPREAGDISVNPPWASTTGSSPLFLHIDASVNTALESGADEGGLAFTYTTDFDGDIRNGSPGYTNTGTAADIGADEFEKPVPVITNVSVPAGTCTPTSHVITADVSTAFGTLTAVTLNYNNGSSGSVSMNLVSGTTYSGTIPAGSGGIDVTWYIYALNSSVKSTTYDGTGYTDNPLAAYTITASATPAAICSGSSATLQVAVTKTASVQVGTGTADANNGTAGFSTGQSFYGTYWGNARRQWIIRASELTAAGFIAGNISALKMNITATGNPTSLTGFTIKMANTAATTLTTAFSSATFTTVYGPVNYTPVIGTNTHNFSTNFVWDGTSNVIIDVCHANQVTGVGSAVNTYTTPGYLCGVSYGADGVPGAGACGTATVSYSNETDRPNFILSGKLSAPVTYSWSDGVTTVGSTNPLIVSPTNTGAPVTKNYTATLTLSGCTAAASAVSVTINSTGTWLGESANWFTAGNWCGGIPSLTTDVYIPAGLAFYPQITTGNALAKTINIPTGASVTVSASGIISLASTITANNNFDLTDGHLNLAGATNLSGTYFYNASVKNMTVSSSALITTGAANMIKLTGRLYFGPFNGTVFTTNGNLTLVSNAAGTAGVNDITNNSINNSNSISGNVIVERYIPAGRKWRFLSVPVTTTQSVKDSWMETATNISQDPKSGYGTIVTDEHAGAVAAGFDAQSVSGPSVKYFVPSAGGGSYTGVATPNTLLNSQRAYMNFVRGNRTSLPSNATLTSTVLRSTGPLKQNSVSFPVAVNTIEAMGNPYASRIDLTKLSNTNMTAFVYVWDPKLTTGYGLGAFQTLELITGHYRITPGGGSYGIGGSIMDTIESGQGFFVKGGTGSPNVQFTEQAKVTGSANVYFTGTNDQTMRVFLSVKTATDTTLMDGVKADLLSTYSNAVDNNDGDKMPNGSESVAIKTGNKLLSVEKHMDPETNDTIRLQMSAMRQGVNYQWKLAAENMDKPGRVAFLVDQLTGLPVPLSLTGNTFYDFNLTPDANSSRPDRFYIVFKTAAVVPVTFTTITAVRQKDESVAIKWNVQNEINMHHYDIERSADGLIFNTQYLMSNVQPTGNNGSAATYNTVDAQALKADNYYRIKAVSNNGQIQYSRIVKVDALEVTPQITVSPNPVKDKIIHLQMNNQPAGDYTMQLINTAGQVVYKTVITVNTNALIKNIAVDKTIPAGTYTLSLQRAGEKAQVQQVVIL